MNSFVEFILTLLGKFRGNGDKFKEFNGLYKHISMMGKKV